MEARSRSKVKLGLVLPLKYEFLSSRLNPQIPCYTVVLGYSREYYHSPVIDNPSTQILGQTPPGVSSASGSTKTMDFRTSKKSPATVADSILVFTFLLTSQPSKGREKAPCKAFTPA